MNKWLFRNVCMVVRFAIGCSNHMSRCCKAYCTGNNNKKWHGSEEAPREARRNVRVSHGSATAAAIYKLRLEGPANSSTRLSAAPLLPLVSGAISPNTRMGGKAAIHLHASIAFRITAIYTIACNQGFQVANGDNTYRNCLPKTKNNFRFHNSKFRI